MPMTTTTVEEDVVASETKWKGDNGDEVAVRDDDIDAAVALVAGDDDGVPRDPPRTRVKKRT